MKEGWGGCEEGKEGTGRTMNLVDDLISSLVGLTLLLSVFCLLFLLLGKSFGWFR